MSKRKQTLRGAWLVGLCLAALIAGAPQAMAQADNDEIVVTAQRRAERLVDVPISVTTLDAQALETANAQDLTDIAVVTPALRFDRQSQFVQPTIRSIGTAITTTGGGSNVGIYVDGFYVPNPAGSDFQLLNVDNIQVLKGPQGTLFGRNTTGGAILVQTRAPSTDTSAEFRASYSSYEQTRAQGYATIGLGERVAVDVEGLFSSGEGRIYNIAAGRDDGDYDNWALRLGLNVDWTENFSTLLRVQHNDSDDARSVLTNSYNDPGTGNPLAPALGVGAANFATAGSFTTDPDSYNPGANQRYLKSEADIFQLTATLNLGWADLTSYTQYRDETIDASTDLDQIGMTIFQLGLPVLNETFSQEFLLTSNNDGPLQWTAGLFYFENTDTYETYIDNGLSTAGIRAPLGGSSAPSQTYAIYADATYQFAPQWYATLGARFARDEVTDAYYVCTATAAPCVDRGLSFGAGERVYVADYEDDHFTPRAVLRYEPTPSSSVYLSYTQGYKAGILDVGGATGNPVNPEEIDAYEIGYKYDSPRLTFETAAFYYDYQDLQVSLFTNAQAQIINAAQSEIYGLEAQVRWYATENLRLNAGLAWTHARYEQFDNAPIYMRCPDPAGCGAGTSFFIASGITLSDVEMQRAPEWTGNIGASYIHDLAGGEMMYSGNLYYTSDFLFGPSGIQFPQDDYTVLSLRAAWTDPSERYTIAVFGENVTDERYVTQVQYNNFGIGSTWNDPATWGVELAVRY